MNISHVDVSIVLKSGDGKAGQSIQPVTLYVTVTVWANIAPPILLNSPLNIPTEDDDSPAEEATKPSMDPDSGGPIQSTAPEPLLPPPDHLPVETGTPLPHGQAEMAPTEDPLVALHRADEAMRRIDPIDQSNTWERAVGRIKWVMDTLGPIAEVRAMSFCLSLTEPTSLSVFPVCKDGAWSAFSDPQGTSFCVIVRTRHSCYIYLVGRHS